MSDVALDMGNPTTESIPTNAAPVTAPEATARDVQAWHAHIRLYEREAETWTKRGKLIVKRYKDERNQAQETQSRLNILWSNVQTLQPALYARNPKPDVSRRFNDADPVGREAANVLERTIGYFAAKDEFGASMRSCVLDYLLPGRGAVWVRYVPHFKDASIVGDQEIEDEGAQTTDDEDTAPDVEDEAPLREVAHEDVLPDYVHWQDFGHTVARTWSEVRAVWRRVFLDKEELIERFGAEIAEKVPLDHKPETHDGITVGDAVPKSVIYELWDKRKRVAIWLHKDMEEALDVRDDPLKLEDFFPCPRPLSANLANDSMIAVPDYRQYQDQAIQLDELTGRIASIVKAIKVAGVYDASAEGVSRILAEGVENQLIPVEAFAMFAEKGGIRGTIELLPMADIISTLAGLYDAREKVKAEIYEVTGLADIIRGNSDPRETAAAQQLKGQFASLRLTDRQSEVQRFARDVIKLMGEVIAGHFGQDTLIRISGVHLFTRIQKSLVQHGIMQPPPGVKPDDLADMMASPCWEDVVDLLRDQPGRSFRIDIETDSTIKSDQQADQAARVQFLTAAGGFLDNAMKAGAQQPALVPLLGHMLMFGVRAFPVGKELEQSFQSALDKLEAHATNPPPSPEQQKLQAQQQSDAAKNQADAAKAQQEAQTEQMRIHAESQAKAADLQAKTQADAAQSQLDAHLETQRMQLDATLRQHEAQLKAQTDAQRNADEDRRAQDQIKLQAMLDSHQAAMKTAADQQQAQSNEMLQLVLAHIKAGASIEVARIAAADDDGAAAFAAEESKT